MSKKTELTKRLKNAGYTDPVVKWIPNNPMGRKGKTTGWVFREKKEENWTKLGENYESAIHSIRMDR